MAFTSVCHISLARARSSRAHTEELQDFFVYLEKEEIIKTIAKKNQVNTMSQLEICASLFITTKAQCGSFADCRSNKYINK